MNGRLTRSTSERMLTGVCGGLGGYFSIDPVIVRMLFVLLTLTSGIGVPVYLILLVVMPRAPRAARHAPPRSHPAHQPEQIAQQQHDAASFAHAGREAVVAGQPAHQQQHAASAGSATSYQLPPRDSGSSSASASYAPQPDVAQTGKTIALPPAQHNDAPATQHNTPAAPPERPSRNWAMLGYILVGIGGMLLFEELGGFNLAFLAPVLLVGIGIVLLLRGRHNRP